VEAYPAASLRREPLAAAYFNPDNDDADQVPQPVLKVSIDTQSTRSSPFTSFKTTSRAHYDAARERVGIKDRTEPREVILYNDEGEVTEASFRNVSFWRDGVWISPPDSSGGLPGTVRRYLIEIGLVREGIVRKDDIQLGEWVMMSNGVDVTILGRMEG
jgi:branched-subunit amino acid aminotransferase/4-amino-4-deoxychorismate lyase